MAYFAPFIDAAGLHTPTYQDIEDYYVLNAGIIFGQDIYLGNDSQDFQMIAAFAKIAYETMQMGVLAYNQRSPQTATGAGFDTVFALNGGKRKGATASICSVTLTGVPYTVITNGIIADPSGNQWDLPPSVVLDNAGHATVTAVCEVLGSITAAIGDLTRIVTPTNGWNSVTNAAAATIGQPIEQDSAAKARQVQSVAVPSQSLVDGIRGSLLAIENVITAQVYENDEGIYKTEINGAVNNIVQPGGTGFPEHSLTCVVKGGDPVIVANVINVKKTPGGYTNGDQTQIVYSADGTPNTIRFYNAISTDIYISLSIVALPSYSSDIGNQIRQALLTFVNSLGCGQKVYNSELVQVVLSVNTIVGKPFFKLTALTAGFTSGSLGTSDLVPDFQHYGVTDTGKITLAVS